MPPCWFFNVGAGNQPQIINLQPKYFAQWAISTPMTWLRYAAHAAFELSRQLRLPPNLWQSAQLPKSWNCRMPPYLTGTHSANFVCTCQWKSQHSKKVSSMLWWKHFWCLTLWKNVFFFGFKTGFFCITLAVLTSTRLVSKLRNLSVFVSKCTTTPVSLKCIDGFHGPSREMTLSTSHSFCYVIESWRLAWNTWHLVS